MKKPKTRKVTISEVEEIISGMLHNVSVLFIPGCTTTCIVRTPGDNEADVLVTNDGDIDELIALLRRSKGRSERLIA